ncbi:MAG TPA: protein kinase [Vicinamibacterales bacterium]|nr:protein kinase [Vicinamibacterales bacterium]
MIGTRLSHYAIDRQLGEGGMGVVYRATDARLNRAVALKVIAADAVADPERKRRFVTEARAASALNHPNIVTIHDIDESDGIDFLVMELISGRPLQELIPPGGLPLALALDYAAQMLGALEAAHAAGIVHRDVKPANVMVTQSGQLKILDFGVAKRIDIPHDASTIAATLATAPGSIVGTMAYMSPEQAHGVPVDARADVFSFGAVFYEMLAGRRAFAREGSLATLAAVINETPPSLSIARRDVPPELAHLVDACLEKDRELRPASAEVARRLALIRARYASSAADVRRILRRPAVAIPLLCLIAAGIAGAWWWRASTARVRWARTVATPEIQRLVAREEYDGAYRLTREALAVLPDDPLLKQIWVDITFLTSITSDPPGADVAIKGYLADDAKPWIPLGRTPLEKVRTPFQTIRVRVTKEGFAPLEALGSAFGLKYALDPPGRAPVGMLRALGGSVGILGAPVLLDDYWIDRYEVSNRQFKEFVDRGGYRNHDYWKEPFVQNARTLTWEEAMALFRDTTGRPGPATWEEGTFPEGQADFPVNGVSWYEASAYATFAGKSLPTAYHWHRAAGYGLFAEILNASNFGSKGPAASGSYKGVGPFGTYDMAGNVKEWCSTGSSGKRFILGGAWNEPAYMFNDLDAQLPFDRAPAHGFRCVKYMKPLKAEVTAAIELGQYVHANDVPARDEVFEVYRSRFNYDPVPLNAVVEASDDLPGWRRDTMTFDAAYGKERVRAYLYLPKNAQKPYQTVIYFPGGDAPMLRSSRDLRLRNVDFIIRSGRAVLYPIYKGMYERGPVEVTGPAGWNELVVARAKDFQRSLDYLATRPDIDSSRLAYCGLSLGATMGVIITAIEPRLKASVLLGGGLDPGPAPPETDIWNFAPRVRTPTLMVNGVNDFLSPLDTAQRPLFAALGPPSDLKHHATFPGGHIPPMHFIIKEILDWFDRFLGPV